MLQTNPHFWKIQCYTSRNLSSIGLSLHAWSEKVTMHIGQQKTKHSTAVYNTMRINRYIINPLGEICSKVGGLVSYPETHNMWPKIRGNRELKHQLTLCPPNSDITTLVKEQSTLPRMCGLVFDWPVWCLARRRQIFWQQKLVRERKLKRERANFYISAFTKKLWTRSPSVLMQWSYWD